MKLETLLRKGRRARVLGVDDAPFTVGSRRDVLVVGAVYSGAMFEGLLSTKIRQDGRNATDRLVRMIGASKFLQQLHLVMLDGLTLGGFNVVDLPLLASELSLPCVSVMRRRPDLSAIQAALGRLPGSARRWRLIQRAGTLHRAGSLWFQVAGATPEAAAQVIDANVHHGKYPECLRAAHLIGSGVVCGESGKRA